MYCRCACDEYACDTCWDMTVRYKPQDSGQEQTARIEQSRTEVSDGETVDCLYDPNDYSDVRVGWSFPWEMVGSLTATGAVLLLVYGYCVWQSPHYYDPRIICGLQPSSIDEFTIDPLTKADTVDANSKMSGRAEGAAAV